MWSPMTHATGMHTIRMHALDMHAARMYIQRVMTILTDVHGTPIPRPSRDEFASDLEFVHAMHTYGNRIASVANEAFAKSFVSALRSR